MYKLKIEPDVLSEKAVDYECKARNVDIEGKTLTEKRDVLLTKLEAEARGEANPPADIKEFDQFTDELNELTELANDIRAECVVYTMHCLWKMPAQVVLSVRALFWQNA
jgi:hypothetical protein